MFKIPNSKKQIPRTKTQDPNIQFSPLTRIWNLLFAIYWDLVICDLFFVICHLRFVICYLIELIRHYMTALDFYNAFCLRSQLQVMRYYN